MFAGITVRHLRLVLRSSLAREGPRAHPIAWLHENGGGRFFYTELGHDIRSLETPFGRQHITEAIKWAAAK